ncbi:guanylate kinase [Acetitomaculum ruminis DSM 5522]|uniref:Guanylate kinase n=1 Tax=Acetitomaculum ruminis DSM 5522 TaxID=1120918 RepID=A0A1I0W7G5_9FIRM|nr:hypothetical protein [Acetitomaculum ruminis]SFA84699.1 guanylate kinase [Acetitomaculum ruminis DSM 5522]
MNKIFCIIGKSSSGKDSVMNELIKDEELSGIKSVITCTTRPKRKNETQGKEYYFLTEEEYQKLKNENKIIEERNYNTVQGLWRYFLADTNQFDFEKNSYIIVETLEGFMALKKAFGVDKIYGIYIFVEDDIRLLRAIEREKKQENPDYKELCRRFLADCEDFSKEKLKEAKINVKIENISLQDTVNAVKSDILKIMSK